MVFLSTSDAHDERLPMSENPFGLQGHVDHLYHDEPRRLAFRAETMDEYAAWKTLLRRELFDLLGLTGRIVPENPRAEVVQTIQRDGYVEIKHALDVGEGVAAPIYVLVPEAPPPYKPVMAFHGHSKSVQAILGNYPDEETKQEALGRNANYAQALAQAGFLVCAVEQRGFGERLTEGTYGGPFPRSCRHLSFEYMMQGRSLVGERCWDGMCAISYVLNRDDVAKGSLGCTGNSGGGTTALWLSAVDERITVSVPSCYFCSFKKSILGMQHCECNYVPGILKWAEMGDLAALIAPRKLRVIAGEKDTIFPIDGVREQFETVKRAYALHGADDACSLSVHPKGHAYNHAMSHEWFKRWM